MKDSISHNIIFNDQHVNADVLLRFLTKKNLKVIRHLFSILFILLLLIGGKKWGEYAGVYDHLDWLCSFVIILSLFYVNMYVIIPKFLYRGKALYYLLILILVIIVTCILLSWIRFSILSNHSLTPRPPDENPIGLVFIGTLIFIPFIMFSTGLKLFQRWMLDTQRINELQKKSIESELQALRNQIHPHFLFNMLNSINILTKIDPNKASYIVIKLSDFLRHLLYETNHKEIFLSTEIKFLKDYLSLEKMRRDNFEYTINYSEFELRGVKIPPNIMLILVENAIKHSADPIDDSYVNVCLSLENEKFAMTVTNSIPTISIRKTNYSGVGLNNLQRRLELLYNNQFYLNSTKNQNEYIVILKLPI